MIVGDVVIIVLLIVLVAGGIEVVRGWLRDERHVIDRRPDFLDSYRTSHKTQRTLEGSQHVLSDITCPMCHAAVGLDDRFCPECGYRMANSIEGVPHDA